MEYLEELWHMLECGQGSGAKQRVLGEERDGLMRLLARREMMMMMNRTDA